MYDIVIAGAGLTGLSLVHSLRSVTQLRTLVVDPGPAAATLPHSPSFDERSTALSLDSCQRLNRLLGKSWQQGLAPMQHIEVSEQGKFGRCQLNCPLDQPYFGLVCANAYLGQQLWQQRPQESIDYAWQHQVLQAEPNADYSLIQLLDAQGQQHSIKTKLLIIADGGRSSLLTQLGIAVHEHDYQQWAHVFNVRVSRSRPHWAFERFTPLGPVAALPRPQANEYAIVMTHPWPLAQHELGAELQQRMGQRLGQIEVVGQCSQYPLKRRRAQELVRHRLALCGNSALSLHPVAGQGFNLALRGANRLGQQIGQCQAQGLDFGQLKHLKPYAQAHQPDLEQIGLFSHSLVQMFAWQAKPWQHARSLGLAALDMLPAAKQTFAHFAMGRPRSNSDEF